MAPGRRACGSRSPLPSAESVFNLYPQRQGFMMHKQMFGAIGLAMVMQTAAIAQEAPMTPLRPDQVAFLVLYKELVEIGVGNGCRRPLPPNPVCSSPATGSPVSCFRIGIG